MNLTIFTPTYNRASLLLRVYESLKRQSSNCFEWIVVDDGSSDNTAAVINRVAEKATFPIRYIKKTNGGKHTAFNLGIAEAKGALFLCLDSDDELCEGAVETIINAPTLEDYQCGYLAWKRDFSGKYLGAPCCGSISEIKCKDVGQGEYAFVFRTALLQNYRYPEFSGERFIGECVVYDMLALAGYSYQILPEVLEICEYQTDGLTSNLNQIMKKNPAGYCLYFMQRIDMATSWQKRVALAGKYHCFCIFAGEKRTAYTGKHRFFVSLTKPIGLVFAVYYKLFRGF